MIDTMMIKPFTFILYTIKPKSHKNKDRVVLHKAFLFHSLSYLILSYIEI